MAQIFLIAFNNLLQHKKRTILLGGAISAVTALLVVLIGLSGGVRETMLKSATTVSTGHITVGGFFKPTSGIAAPVITDYKKVEDVVRKTLPELDFLVERGRGWARIVSDTNSTQAGISGVNIDIEKGLKEVLQIKSGNLSGLKEKDTIVIFEEQAKKLSVKVGDMLTISTSTPSGIANTVDVRIVAIAANIGLLSSMSVFIPTESNRNLYQLNSETTGAIFLYFKNMDNLSAIRSRLFDALKSAGYRMMDPDPRAFFMKFQSVSREDWSGQKIDLTIWDEEVSFLMWTIQTIDGMTLVLISVLLIIIVVGIMNTMWVAIRERTKEIGTLRAIGMQKYHILLMFLCEGALLGMIGTILGAMSGLLISFLLNSIHITVPDAAKIFLMSDVLSFYVPFFSVLKSIVLISFITMLAVLYPAYRAARLKPVIAMHHAG